MNSWETLVASALVGTDRQAPVIDTTHPALIDYQVPLQHLSAAQQILSAAGLVTLYQAIGHGSKSTSLDPLISAAQDNLPYCSDFSVQYLHTILNEHRYADVLPEFLKLLTQAHQTVPPDLLPLLLDLGKRDRSLRPFILPILGHRGEWLVRQNPSWEYGRGTVAQNVSLAELQAIWETGSRSERMAALRQWRAIEPEQARQAVVTSWKQDKADDRQSWLEVLQSGLSLADEELLEVALTDRSESVRYQAASLLNQIPSQYRLRLTQLASSFVVIKAGKKGYTITINLPQESQQVWQVPGISNKLTDRHSIHGLTLPEWQLLQAISGTELSVWSGEIDQLITAAMKAPRSVVILTGWARAACAQKRVDWLEELFMRSQAILPIDDIHELLQSLLTHASDRQEQFFAQLLATQNDHDTLPKNLELIMAHHHHWSHSLSQLVVQKFQEHIQQLDVLGYYYVQQSLSTELGKYLHVGVLKELQDLQAELSLEKFSYNTCIELLTFRCEMQVSFNTT